MNLDDLMGQALRFYGVDNNRFRLGGDGWLATFEAVEDESDGYRSMMRDVQTIAEDPGGTFFREPIAGVVAVAVKEGDGESGTDLDGYELRDIFTGHVWLRLGTRAWNDYYPCFTFDYQPSGKQLTAFAPA